jgi:hypothetical protein
VEDGHAGYEILHVALLTGDPKRVRGQQFHRCPGTASDRLETLLPWWIGAGWTQLYRVDPGRRGSSVKRYATTPASVTLASLYCERARALRRLRSLRVGHCGLRRAASGAEPILWAYGPVGFLA